MGILNATPDSFSQTGSQPEPEWLISSGLQMVEQGADILDVGGESTRPGSASVSEEEELRRVMPVIEGLARDVRVPLSIDTMKPHVAAEAVRAGASIVNDVGANRTDPTMWEAIASSGAAYVCMHMQGTPRTMQINPHYDNVRQEVTRFFSDRIRRLSGCGITPERIILDPGIGFGKTLEHNLQLLGALRDFARLGCPLLLGVSRKSFMGKLLGVDPGHRLAAGLACACLAAQAGVNIIRTHDVSETVQALRMAEAILANSQEN